MGEPDSAGRTYGKSFADVYDDWYQNVTNVDETVDTLIRLAAGGDLLELGVGTGRIAIPLARRLSGNQKLTGIDESEEMLEIWRSKLEQESALVVRSNVVRGDMSAPLPRGPYSVVFCTFNTFFNLPSHDAQLSCLLHSADVLAPGGAIVLEFAVFPDAPNAVCGEFTDEFIRPDGSSVRSTSVIDPTQHTVTGYFTDAQGRERPWTIRYATPQMIAGMALEAGLVITDVWEDFGRRPFLSGSARQVCVLRRRLGGR